MTATRCPRPEGKFPGTNIMTPEVLGYYKVSDGYVELSRGRGIYDDPLYGVTYECDKELSEGHNKLSRVFRTYGAAWHYIRQLAE